MAEEATAASQSLATEGEQLARLIDQFAVSKVSQDAGPPGQDRGGAGRPAKAEPASAARPRAGRREPREAGGERAEADWREF